MFFENARPVLNPVSPGTTPDFSESVSAGFEEQRRFGSVYGLEIDYRNKFTSQLESLSEMTGKTYNLPLGTRPWLNTIRQIQGEETTFNGDIDQNDYAVLQQINSDILSLKAENPDAEFLSLEELYGQLLEEDKQKQAQFDDLAVRGDFSNSVGNFIGAMAGSFSFERDPLNVLTLGVGGAGKTIASRMASEAGANAIVEGLNQITGVAENDALRGREKTFSDYALSIGAAAGGAALIRGGIDGITGGVSRIQKGKDYGFLNDIEPENIDEAIRAFESTRLSDDEILNRIRQAESNGGDPRFQKNPDSSASGDFQFIDSTWRRMVETYGDELGIGVSDKADPRAQRLLAQKLLEENRSILKNKGVNNPASGDLYVAHFAGPTRAARLIKLRDSDQSASNVFPKSVIEANKTIYKNKDGSIKSLKEVYDILVGKVGQKQSSISLAKMNPVERNLSIFERTMDETNPLHRAIKHRLDVSSYTENDMNPLPDIIPFQRFHNQSMQNASELLQSPNEAIDVPPIELLPSIDEVVDFSQDVLPERFIRSQKNITDVAQRQQQVQADIVTQTEVLDDLLLKQSLSQGKGTESFFETPENIDPTIQRFEKNQTPELDLEIREVRKRLSSLEQQSRNLENEYVNRWNRLSNQIATGKFSKAMSNYQPALIGDPPAQAYNVQAHEALKNYDATESASVANELNELRADDTFIQELKSEPAFREFADEIENGLTEADIEEQVLNKMNECAI